MELYKKGSTQFLIILILSFFLIAGTIIITYKYEVLKLTSFQKQRLPDSLNTSPSSQFPDWQVYKDEKYGLSFEYPKDYKVSVYTDPNKENHYYVSIVNPNNQMLWYGHDENKISDIYFSTSIDVDMQKSLEEVIENYEEAECLLPHLAQKECKTLQKPFTRYSDNGIEGYTSVKIPYEQSVEILLIDRKSYVLDINSIGVEGTIPTEKSNQIRDQILSTFRFLDEDTITNTTPEPNATNEGQFCGGFAGIECAPGLICKLEGHFPDAGGYCVRPEVKK